VERLLRGVSRAFDATVLSHVGTAGRNRRERRSKSNATNLGAILMDKGDQEGARKQIERALAIDEKSKKRLEVYQHLSLAQVEAGYERAVKAIEI
jgi:Tfp pilus assembly protein PilF